MSDPSCSTAPWCAPAWSARGRMASILHLGHRPVCLHPSLVHDPQIVTKASNVANYCANSHAAFIVVLQAKHRLAREPQNLQGSQSTSQPATHFLVNDVESTEDGLCLRHSERAKSIKNPSPLRIVHPEKMRLHRIGLLKPSFDAGVRVQNLRIEVCKDQVRLSRPFGLGNFMGGRGDAMGCSRYGIGLLAKPKNSGSGKSSDQSRKPGYVNRDKGGHNRPCIPIDGAHLAHGPALTEAKPPIHSQIPLAITGILPRPRLTGSRNSSVLANTSCWKPQAGQETFDE